MEALLELGGWRALCVAIPLAATLVPAAILDALYGRIPNAITYPAFVVGLVVHTIAWGWSALPGAVGAAALTLVVGLLLRAPGWLGGGDVKLLTALAAFVGLGALGESLFYAIWVGFVLGLLQTVSNGAFFDMLRRIGRFFLGVVRAVGYRTDQVLEELETDEASTIPFAVAIFAGVVLAWTEARYGWPGLFAWFFDGTLAV